MITTRLMGGLGNQMYQYAAGLAISKKLNTGLYIDLSWFDEVKGMTNVTQRDYELGPFGISPRPLTFGDKLSIKLNRPVVFKETNFGYDDEFKHISGNVTLEGYWQSYKYFEAYRDDVTKAFKFPKLGRSCGPIIKKIADCESISVHVRRGDYANDKKTRNYHGLLGPSYYSRAVDKITIGINNPNIFVFSDDPAWCKKNLKFNLPTTYFGNGDAGSGVGDMHLMSLCKNNIIANSSFSWWAAWLNQNPDKIVCAPKNWFNSENAHLEDRLPKDWLTI